MQNNNTNSNELSMKAVFKSFRYLPRIFKLLWDTKKNYLIIIVCLNIVLGLIPVLNLLITQNLINAVVLKDKTHINTVIIFFIILILISLFNEIIILATNYFQGLFQNLLSYNINVKIMQKSSELTLSDFENSTIYDMLQRAQSEAGFRPFQVFISILSIITGIVTLTSSAIILFAWKWWIALIVILVPAVSTISFLKQGQREFLNQWKRAATHRKAWYITYLLTKDINFKEIKLYELSNHLIKQYTDIYSDFYKQDKSLIKRRTKITFLFEVLNQITVASVIALIVFETFVSKIKVGNLVGYIKAVTLTQSNSQGVLKTIFTMYQNNLYIKQLFEFLDLPTSSQSEKTNINKCEVKEIHEIEFKNVSFRYPNSPNYALKNVSLKISFNDNIAIVGENGSGKSTFVKLLTGLYKAESGHILINGHSLEQWDLDSYRRRIGVVFQDYVKYELPVRANIGFGQVEYINNDVKLLAAAQKSGIDDVITNYPNKLDTQLGVWFENGTQLSGGQWQKVSLARAFLKEADLYVLDEPSSALDPISEKEIFDKFFSLTYKKIGIFISHRFSNVKNVNKILVFSKGELVEQGNHTELMKLNKHYAKLYNIQASPYEKSDQGGKYFEQF